jgi:integral membrane protein
MEMIFGREQAIRNFLSIGKLEGLSFLTLLFIAMPLKYMFNHPEIVRVVGMLHGVLFVFFIISIVILLQNKQLSVKNAVFAFLLSIIPFGTFFLKKLV